MGVRFKKAKNGLHLNLSGHHCLKRRCQEDVLPGRLRFDLEFSGVTLTTHGTSKSHHGGWRCLQNPRRFMPRIICAKRCHFPRSKLRANLTRPTQTSASHTPGCPNSQCTRSSRLGRMHPFGQKRSFEIMLSGGLSEVIYFASDDHYSAYFHNKWPRIIWGWHLRDYEA